MRENLKQSSAFGNTVMAAIPTPPRGSATGDNVSLNLYDESIPMLWVSSLVYTFAELVEEARKGTVKLPPSLASVLVEYKDKRLDVRNFNKNHGLSFNQIDSCLMEVKDTLIEMELLSEFGLEVIKSLKQQHERADEDTLYLETFDSIKQTNECVYGVVKDEKNKRVIVIFRGTVTGTMDWARNLEAHFVEMRTPKLLRQKLEGELQENVLVHEGFYSYLFDNEFADGTQRYDNILDDIKPFVENGYKIYVTGHSLGAALSSLLAFKLAGTDLDWIPKPITCISYASPFVGSKGFRTAFQQLEKDGLIRYLRVTNTEDIVPTIPPFSLGLKNKGLFKHVGVHLNIHEKDFQISYPRDDNQLQRALGNSLFKLGAWPFSTTYFHGLSLSNARLKIHQEELEKMTIDGLYENEVLARKD